MLEFESDLEPEGEVFDLGAFQRQFVEAVIQRRDAPECLQHMVPTRTRSAIQALQTYQNDYSARLSDVLAEHFASSHYIIGDAAFFELCAAYIREQRSQHYDLGQIGRAWPEFVAEHALSQEFPFLSDLARWECLLDSCFHIAPSPPCDLSPLENLSDPDALYLEFVPSLRFLQSPYPILKLWRLRKAQSRPDHYPALDCPAYLIAFKNARGLRHAELNAVQFVLLQALQRGLSLGAAFNALSEDSLAAGGLPEALSALFALLKQEELVSALPAQD